MAWKLRQFFEGDQLLTVEGVTSAGTECWDDPLSVNIVPSTIAIKVNGVETLITAATVSNNFLTIPMPAGILIGPSTTIQVYAVCEDDPESKSATLTAKPVFFQVSTSAVKSCNPQVILSANLVEYIRFFFQTNAGDYFNAKWAGANLDISSFAYQTGETGNIVSTAGNFSRPATGSMLNTLISTGTYSHNPLTIVPASLLYFTARFGYIEIIFDNGNLSYINYMQSGDVGTLGTYVVGDTIVIESLADKYIIRKNNTSILTKTKAVTYTVTGGTITPSTSTLETPVAWNLPVGVNNYTVTATVGNSLKFSQIVRLHSCADAIDDSFTGVYNTPYSGNVYTNDVTCTGENNYYELVPSTTIGGTLVFNQNGTFTFTPTTNFNGNGTFQYRIRCGTSFGSSEIVDTATVTISYYDICNGVVANWQPTNQTKCESCTEQREERDLNSQCTGNVNRWVNNPGGGACNSIPNWVDTSQKRCQSCINQKEQQDLNTCSPTYLTYKWVFDINGTLCNSTPNWIDNGSFICENCVEKKQQLDVRSCSSTYDTTRYVSNPGGTQCVVEPNWIDTGENVCLNCTEYKKQKDQNSCSSTYNVIRNIPDPNGNVCDNSINWVDTGSFRCNNGIHEKQQESNSCQVSVRWIVTGLDLCGCTVTTNIQNTCNQDNVIVGAEVYKLGVVENNRVTNFNNGTVTFVSDSGTFDYMMYVTFLNGIKSTILHKNYKCQSAESVPNKPINFNATAISTSVINLSWTDNSLTKTYFEIERSLDGNIWTNNVIVDKNILQYNVTGLSEDVLYYFRVRTKNTVGYSDWALASATTLEETTPIMIPSVPTNLTATSVGITQINLNWTDTSNNETGFDIERSLDGATWGTLASVGADSTTYASSGLTGSTQYYYRVRSKNAQGVSEWSNVANATTSSNNITSYWGWKDNNTMPTVSEILEFQGLDVFTHNTTITADFTGAGSTPYYLYMAELITEVPKQKWYVNDLNNELINGTTGTWIIQGTVGQYRIYVTSFKTAFDGLVQFQIITLP